MIVDVFHMENMYLTRRVGSCYFKLARSARHGPLGRGEGILSPCSQGVCSLTVSQRQGVPSPVLGASTSRGALFISDGSLHRSGNAVAPCSASTGSGYPGSLLVLRSGGLRCRDLRPCATCVRGGAMGQCGAMGHWWWLWESLGLTSDLGKALACRKDTASSRVSSAATELTVSVVGWVAAWGPEGISPWFLLSIQFCTKSSLK